jgi:hypothetical protein
VLANILAENDIVLPECPLVRTPTGGYHRYLRVPKGYRVWGTVAMWPGVDILAQASNVVLAGSQTKDGTYTVLRGFDVPIPEAPIKLLKLIHKRQKPPTRVRRRLAPVDAGPAPSSLSPP